MTKTIELSEDQLQTIRAQHESIQEDIAAAVEAGSRLNPAREFVFFAAFDGTNNDKDELAGNDQSTNVGQLWEQYQPRMARRVGLGGNYYPGLGTKGRSSKETWLSPVVNRGVRRNAEKAFEDFKSQAATWLASRRRGKAKVVLTAFSRGVASAAIFSQLLHERGLLAPGDVAICAGVLFDPVATGVEDNLAFASNVKGLINIKAANEYRSLFRAVDYSRHEDTITTIEMYGNHCDIGGGYDNGLGGFSLQVATTFLQAVGLPVEDVPAPRRHDPSQICVHDESSDGENTIWDVDHEFTFADARLADDDIRIA